MRPPFINATRGLASALAIVSSLALSGCYVEAGILDVENDVYIQPTYQHYERGDEFSITVTNSGGDRLLLSTCASELEREVNGNWVRIVFDIGSFSCPDVLYSVGRHESREFDVDILSPNRRIPTTIPAGRYRIVLPELREEGSGHSYSKDSRRSDSFWVD